MSESASLGVATKLAQQELLERLDHFSLAPKLVVEIGSALATRPDGLRQKFPRARIVAVTEPGEGRAVVRRGGRLSLRALFGKLPGFCAQVEHVEAPSVNLPFADASVDVVVADCLLAGSDRLDAVLAEVGRILRPGALFLWNTPGPGSRSDQAYARTDFIDMHDIGSALGRAGFAEPVLDVDRLGDVEVIQVAAFAGAQASGEIFVAVDSIGRRSRTSS